MPDRPDGIEGMVGEALSTALAPSQPELFENFDGPEGAALPAGSRPRPGRPRGAINKRHEQLRAWWLARFPHPLEALGAMVSMKAVDLAKELDCKPIDALDLQRKALADVLPYVESKQPVELDAGEGAVIPVIVFRDRGAPVNVTATGGSRLSILDHQPQQNQHVSDLARDVSPDGKSHDNASD